MNPEEKAKELVQNMFNVDLKCDNEAMCMLYPHAIKCALIAVDELIEAVRYLDDDSQYFYQEVKHEIEKL
jgi:hypothetical protein